MGILYVLLLVQHSSCHLYCSMFHCVCVTKHISHNFDMILVLMKRQ